METSLSPIESSDYATYDRIIREINTYSKQATNVQSNEYVSYDNVVRNFSNLTRSHSADLEGYVTTEVCGILFSVYLLNPELDTLKSLAPQLCTPK